MKQAKAFRSGITGLLCLMAGSLHGSARAQRQFPFVASQTSPSSGVLDAEPKLNMKVWLTASDSNIAHMLTELTARTVLLTHFRLQARASVQQIPVSCYVAGVPLRDVLDGLTVFSTLQWQQMGKAGFELGISFVAPGPRFRRPRTAYYGMRVIRQVEKQPAAIREMLKAGPVRLDSLPAPVQQAVQALLRVRSEEGRRGNRPQMEWPVDPKTTLVRLDEETYAGETQYQLRISREQSADDRYNDYGTNIFFTPTQAAEYQRDPRIDGEASDHDEAIRKDPRFALPVTVVLHSAPLSAALQTLFTATHVPLLAAGSEHPVHADIVCKQLPLSEALDRICAAYGYRWERLESGIVTLLVNGQ